MRKVVILLYLVQLLFTPCFVCANTGEGGEGP